jgi:hypothetical protein
VPQSYCLHSAPSYSSRRLISRAPQVQHSPSFFWCNTEKFPPHVGAKISLKYPINFIVLHNIIWIIVDLYTGYSKTFIFSSMLSLSIYLPEDGGCLVLRNFGVLPQHDAVSQSRRLWLKLHLILAFSYIFLYLPCCINFCFCFYVIKPVMLLHYSPFPLVILDCQRSDFTNGKQWNLWGGGER